MKGVKFEPPKLVFPPTYISVVTRLVFKMENTSDEPRKVSFHKTRSAKEDQLEIEAVDAMDPAGRERIAAAGRFSDDIFSIEPLEMTIWPNSMSQVIVTFEPKVAIKYHLPVYIQVDDSPTRGKLDVFGEGLAPVARFQPDAIGVGHVNLDSLFEYEVELRNEGEVPVDYCLEQKESVLKYKFTPMQGVIPVGQAQKIRAEIVAVNVGNFVETFEFKVKGVLEHHPRIQFSGKVIGPSFVITPRRLDFGGCSYGFLHRQKIGQYFRRLWKPQDLKDQAGRKVRVFLLPAADVRRLLRAARVLSYFHG